MNYICKDEIIDNSKITKRLFHKILKEIGLEIKCGYSLDELKYLYKCLDDYNSKRYLLKQQLKVYVTIQV